MFTPPPSPDPYRTKRAISPAPLACIVAADEDGFLAVPLALDEVSNCSSRQPLQDLRQQSKLETTRRIRWTILLVPAILILITASTRYISQFASISSWPSEQESVSSGMPTGWQGHRREANPEPAPLPQTDTAGSNITTQSVPQIPSTPPQLPSPFPQALDESLSTNFTTQACENFFLNMTSSAPFRSCRPFSLLFQTSSEFVLQAQTNLTGLNNIVWGTCNTTIDEAQCSENMAWFATDIQQECSEDVQENNAVVMQTLKGLQTYDLYRTTACLADQATNAYCYVEAVHSTSPADLYFYSLPLGIELPASITPSCSPCMKSVMGIFEQAVSNNTALSQVYNGAATVANNACGSGFVATVSTSGGDRVAGVSVATLVLGVLVSLLLW
ncbi:hypothetical protein BC835DRAFT_1323951 [Cytidiella melzeri]|nr:hypothetical protein BC835DRAFT_1323951 [Cytidiella melzeri]